MALTFCINMDTLLQIVSRDLNDIVIPRTQFISVHADAGM